MKRKLLCTALLSLFVPAVAMAQPIQWVGNGHWYQFLTPQLSWHEAFSAASAMTHNGMQGYLATITSVEENAFVANEVANGVTAWLGGSDDGAESNWTWRSGPESGQAFTFLGWVHQEPNNTFPGEHWVHINVHEPGGWNDAGLAARSGYVVEFSAVVVPEPMSGTLVAAGLVALAITARRRRD